MTRISVKELLDDMTEDEAGNVRDCSPSSRGKETTTKRKMTSRQGEDRLIFETMVVDRDGVEENMEVLGISKDEANINSWKNFRNYMIRKSGIEKKLNRKSEVRVFYVDEEDDEIFVDSDDEYKELLRLTSLRNKEGNTMELKFINTSKTRKSKVDLLAREVRSSPGKVIKKQSNSANKHSGNDSLGSKAWRLHNSSSSPSSRSSIRTQSSAKTVFSNSQPIKVTVGLNNDKPEPNVDNVKKKKFDICTSRSSGVSSLSSSPRNSQSAELLRQQAGVFDWMLTNKETEEPKDTAPAWFQVYMETYKDDLAAEITTKVVHSLGIIIENKLSGFMSHPSSKRSSSSCSCSDQGKHAADTGESKNAANKKQRDNKKVKKEAMRMTMEINGDSKDSKELKKLKKSLVKKTDKVVKVAMKIEKKNQQEDKSRKSSLTSSSSSDCDIKLTNKKDKKAHEEKKKVKKSKSIKETSMQQIESTTPDADYPASLVQTYSVTPVKTTLINPANNYPFVKPPVPTSDVITPLSDNHVTIRLPRPQLQQSPVIITSQHPLIEKLTEKNMLGKLTPAVYISEENELVQNVSPGTTVTTKVKLTNLGCVAWEEGSLPTAQKGISSSGLISIPEAVIPLPSLQPGEEGTIMFLFTVPATIGNYDAVWYFFDQGERFGPPLKFKFKIVRDEAVELIPISTGTEMTDFGGDIDDSSAVEMKGIGISAKSQEMVEMNSKKDLPIVLSSVCTEIITIPAENDNGNTHIKEVEQKSNEEDEFDLLANEVDTLTIEESYGSYQRDDSEDDFEVVPVPSCFNLDIPFEIVEQEESERKAEENIPTEQLKNDSFECSLYDKKDIAEAATKIDLVVANNDEETISNPMENVQQLVDLGFANREENLQLLKLNNNCLDKVLSHLVKSCGNNWAGNRH